jgi:hypothetical protein
VKTKLLKHQTSSLINDFCASLLKEEITYASAGIIEGSSLYSAFSHPAWQQSYVNFSLHLHDPSFIAAIKTPFYPIFWDTVPKNTTQAAAVMERRCEMTGVASGVTVSFHRDSKILLLTMGSKLSSIELLTKLNNEIFPHLKIEDILCQKINQI